MATENTAPETGGQTATAEPQTGTQETVSQEVQTQEQPKAFDPNSLPAEAKQHFEKQYEGYDKFKGMAQEYERLLKAPEFQQWYQGLRAPKQPEAKRFELSNEDFVAALSDPKKFSQTVYSLAEQIANEKLAPQIQQTQWEVNLQKRTSEIERAMVAHPDFKDLDAKGLIEPILMKYPTIGIEDAYWLAKRHTMNDEIDRRARGLVQIKKNASTERPGTSAGARSNKVTAKTTLEAMEIAAEAFRQGREVPDIDIE